MSDVLIGALIGTLTAVLAAITIFRTRSDCNSYRELHLAKQAECWDHVNETVNNIEARLGKLEDNFTEFLIAQRRIMSTLVVSLPIQDDERLNLIRALNGK